jgi:hypothetical protein
VADHFFDFAKASNDDLNEVLNLIANPGTPLADYMALVGRYIRPDALGVDWSDRYAFTVLSSAVILELQGLFSEALAQEYRARTLFRDGS